MSGPGLIGKGLGMTTDTETRSLHEVLKDFRFANLVTTSASAGLTARPLTVAEHQGGVVRFLVDSEADWITDADSKPVLLSLADPKGNSFASVSGTAVVQRNEDTIKRLYGVGADTFFDGVDDPRIRVLEVTATTGEWWDGPSGLGRKVALAVAHHAGDESKIGDSGTIDVR